MAMSENELDIARKHEFELVGVLDLSFWALSCGSYELARCLWARCRCPLRAALPKPIDLGKLVPLVDVSGSMFGTPMEVAIALGILQGGVYGGLVAFGCFWLSFIIEWLSSKRYNLQSKPILFDHNPLVVRKGLQSVSIDESGVDQAFQPISIDTGKKGKAIGTTGLFGYRSEQSKEMKKEAGRQLRAITKCVSLFSNGGNVKATQFKQDSP